MQYLPHILYTTSILVSAIGAYAIQTYGSRLGVLDEPDRRSSHRKTTPKGGGIGIVASFVLAALLLDLPLSISIPPTLLSFFSLYGDKSDIPPKLRLIVQFGACIILLFGIFSITHGDYLLLIPFSVFIVGTANYYNFMDGINGIAGITGVIAFGFLSYYAFISDMPSDYIMVNMCLSFACLGFLPFNIPEAKVFMGDAGSIFLGFIFAAFVVLFSERFLDFICLISFLFPFYSDELTTLIVRIRDGDQLTNPHRKHLYQLLANELSIAHWKVSAGYGVLQIMIGIVFLSLRSYGFIPMLLLLTVFFLLFAYLSYAVRKKIRHFMQSQTLQNH